MKKVLIITYYWPPSGGGGVQRWLKFAKYLPEFGWEPLIYTPENPDFPIQDASLLKDVSNELEVIKLPIWEPYQLFEKISGKKTPAQGLVSSNKKKSWFTNLVLWIRGNFFIPDPRRFWVKPSVKFLKDIVESNDIKTIVTTGPPHSIHLIGLGLKKKMNIRWVADFRDPWSKWDMLDSFKLSSLAKSKHKKLELNVLKNADRVLTVSDTWAKEFETIYTRPYDVITNGYDEEDFGILDKKGSENYFVISHFGLINNFRNPRNFWKALKEMTVRRKIKVKLYGVIEQNIQDQIRSDDKLNKMIEIKPSISHEEVIKAYKQSDLLLLLLNNSKNAEGHIPGKLFEYLASNRPILSIGSTEGDVANILFKTSAGRFYKTTDDLAEPLEEIINNGWDLKRGDIKKFSRKSLTSELVNKVLEDS